MKKIFVFILACSLVAFLVILVYSFISAPVSAPGSAMVSAPGSKMAPALGGATSALPASVPGLFNVKEFGALGDGNADDTDAIQKAINAALKSGTAVYIPRGTYLVTKPIQLRLGSYSPTRALRITGDWPFIKAGAKMASVMDVNAAAFLTVQRLILDGNNLADVGFYGFKISGRTALIEQLQVQGAVSNGFSLEKCQGSVFRNCMATKNGGDGWYLVDCNAAVLDAVGAVINQGNGYTLTIKDFSGGAILTSFWSEGNKGHGVLVNVSKLNATVTLRDGWIEGNELDGVRVESMGTILSGLQIMGSGKDGNRAIRLTASALGSHVTGCYVQNGPGSPDYARITVEGDPAKQYVAGNFCRFRGALVNPEIIP